jgi:excisionase family DNA binding protein
LVLLDPLIVGHHNTSRGHREHKEPDLEAEQVIPAVRQAEPQPEPAQERAERFNVTMAPITLTVADAARVIGLSKSTISELARSGTIPSLRVGSRMFDGTSFTTRGFERMPAPRPPQRLAGRPDERVITVSH